MVFTYVALSLIRRQNPLRVPTPLDTPINRAVSGARAEVRYIDNFIMKHDMA